MPLAPWIAGAAEALLRRRHAGQRVLLAEDNPINHDLADELLRGVGLVVATADDGVRAIELALARDHDLILMEMQMPEQDGLAAGMNDHVAKPVDPGLLCATLLRWLPLPEAAAPGNAQPDRDTAALRSPEERLAATAGMDVTEGLRNVGGNWQRLERVLRRFVSTCREGEPVLSMAAATSALDSWRAACHSLRGACGAVAAVQLQRDVAALGQALSPTADVATLVPQALRLNQDLRRLVQRIESALGS